MRFIWQALSNGAHIQRVVGCTSLMAPMHRSIMTKLQNMGIPTIDVLPQVFHSLCLTDNPQGIIAIVRQRMRQIDQLVVKEKCQWIALTTIQSPGNFGTIMRTAEAVGVSGILLLSDELDPYHPNTVRASMGSIFSLQFARASVDKFQAWRQKHNCCLIGTSPQAITDYQSLRYPARAILLMGGERKGLSKEHQALCDHMVSIPMEGKLDSLNLAIATSIVLYELYNQQRQGRKNVQKLGAT